MKYFLPSKSSTLCLPELGITSTLSDTWQDVAKGRELGLPKRSAKAQENLSTHVKEHALLELEDSVMVQKQAVNNALR